MVYLVGTPKVPLLLQLLLLFCREKLTPCSPVARLARKGRRHLQGVSCGEARRSKA